VVVLLTNAGHRALVATCLLMFLGELAGDLLIGSFAEKRGNGPEAVYYSLSMELGVWGGAPLLTCTIGCVV
jgi:hypothetical protein